MADVRRDDQLPKGFDRKYFEAELRDIIESRKRRFEIQAKSPHGSYKIDKEKWEPTSKAPIPEGYSAKDAEALRDLVRQIEQLERYAPEEVKKIPLSIIDQFLSSLSSVRAETTKHALRLARHLKWAGSPDSGDSGKGGSGGAKLEADDEAKSNGGSSSDPRPPPKSSELELVGLALSGGGIRSAAFCFGALQALAKKAVPRHVDYLSTVSGGGYIGACWSCVLQATGPSVLGKMAKKLEAQNINPADFQLFPFIHVEGEPETPQIAHLRNWANYLAPRGFMDYLRAPVLLTRGMVLSFLVILKYLLFFAILTVLIYAPIVGSGASSYTWVLVLLIAFVACIVLYTLAQTLLRAASFLDRIGLLFDSQNPGWAVRSFVLRWTARLTLLFFLAVFFQSQPFLVRHMQELTQDARGGGMDFLLTQAFWSETWVAITAIIGGLAAWLAKLTSRTKAQLTHKISLMLACAVVPVVLWLVYLTLCRWAVYDTGPFSTGGRLIVIDEFISTHFALQFMDDIFAWTGAKLAWFVQWITGAHEIQLLSIDFDYASRVGNVLAIYVVVSVVLLILSPFFNPNVFSLHNFYRDALSKTFLFGILDEEQGRTGVDHRDTLRLSKLDISKTGGPYHLINTTVNHADLGDVNYRGRRSDFFLFSPRWTGNDILGYVSTHELEESLQHVTLATAMAISAAAAAPNTGERVMNPLVRFALAVLNVRLNYWLPAPKSLGFAERRFGAAPPFYFIGEIGWLPKWLTGNWLNLSDGGHIENLGIYELLRRRCRYIIAIDSEADPDMTFSGLATVIKLARIDMGIQINIDLDGLRKDDRGLSMRHWALGDIRYSETCYGELLYIKASVTGGENEYITEYRANNPTFPHETTANQFFDETQIECYRALGYECGISLFEPFRRERAPAASELFGQSLQLRTIASFFDDLRQRLASDGVDDDIYIKLQAQRAAIEKRVYCEPTFAAYAAQLAPHTCSGPSHSKKLQPKDCPSYDPCLHQIVNEQMQLMERAVVGLNLHEGLNRQRPRNRGWMNLFRSWAEAPIFRSYWACCISDYSAAFQRFCTEALGLDLQVSWAGARAEDLTAFETTFCSLVRKRAPTAKTYVASVCAGPFASDSDATTGTSVRVAVAMVEQYNGLKPLLVAFRIRDTYRGMRLSEPLLKAFRDGILARAAAEARKEHGKESEQPVFTFDFVAETSGPVPQLEQVLLRLHFLKAPKPQRQAR